MRNGKTTIITGSIAIVLCIMALTGCSYPAIPGSTYLAINWTSVPQAMLFPAFPPVIYAGEYVEHAPGTYAGEYIAWDGTYWVADYWIAVDEGQDGSLLVPVDHGDDSYMSMWLYSFGPSMYTDYIVTRSVVGNDAAAATANQIRQVGADAPELVRARELAVGVEPKVFEEQRHWDGFVLRIELRRYDIEATATADSW